MSQSGDYRYIPPSPPLSFVVSIIAGFGAIVGLLTATGDAKIMLPYAFIGGLIFALLAAALTLWVKNRMLAGLIAGLTLGASGIVFISLPYGLLLGLFGFLMGRMSL